MEDGEKSLKSSLKVRWVEDKFKFSNAISRHLLYISMMNARQENQPLYFLSIINEQLLVGVERGENGDYRRPAHLSNDKSSRDQFKQAQMSAFLCVHPRVSQFFLSPGRIKSETEVIDDKMVI